MHFRNIQWDQKMNKNIQVGKMIVKQFADDYMTVNSALENVLSQIHEYSLPIKVNVLSGFSAEDKFDKEFLKEFEEIDKKFKANQSVTRKNKNQFVLYKAMNVQNREKILPAVHNSFNLLRKKFMPKYTFKKVQLL
jgi:hypothetical protein